MKRPEYQIPDKKKIRVIIDSDANCECDDQYAIVHGLLTPKLQVMGIVAEQYGEPGSMLKSYQEIQKICELGGFDTRLAHKGMERPLTRESSQGVADGVEFMIREALREDPRPLFVICQGALTNVAAALLKCPQIASHMLLIIVGGCNYPKGGYEFNTMNDRRAFQTVMDSPVPVWMLPEEVYATMQAGLSELLDKVWPYGETGKYLVENTLRNVERMLKKVPDDSKADLYGAAIGFPNGESWCLGDLAGIGLLLSHCSGSFQEAPAPDVAEDGTYYFHENAKIVRWYTEINQRLILEDFFAKIKHYDLS